MWQNPSTCKACKFGDIMVYQHILPPYKAVVMIAKTRFSPLLLFHILLLLAWWDKLTATCWAPKISAWAWLLVPYASFTDSEILWDVWRVHHIVFGTNWCTDAMWASHLNVLCSLWRYQLYKACLQCLQGRPQSDLWLDCLLSCFSNLQPWCNVVQLALSMTAGSDMQLCRAAPEWLPRIWFQDAMAHVVQAQEHRKPWSLRYTRG